MEVNYRTSEAKWTVRVLSQIAIYFFPDDIYRSQMSLWRVNRTFRLACEKVLPEQQRLLQEYKDPCIDDCIEELTSLIGGEENLEFQLCVGEPIKYHEFDKVTAVQARYGLDAASQYNTIASRTAKVEEKTTSVSEFEMFGVKGWLEGLSTHMWLRACTAGLGVG